MFASAQDIEVALKKQRLQLQSAALRERIAEQGAALAPAFAIADRVEAGRQWLKAHPDLVLAFFTGLLIVRPRRAFRWARRSLFAWRAWRRLNDLLGH